jgi:magnesium transporter
MRRTIVSTKNVITQPTDDPSIVEAMKATDKVLWLDIEKPTPQDLALLQEGFGFHPLSIEDVAQQHSTPKLDEYDTYVFQVVMVPQPNGGHDRAQLFEVEVFYLPGTLVTVRERTWPALDALWEAVRRDPVRELGKGAQVLYHNIVDRAVDAYWPLLEAMDERVEHLERQVLQARGQDSTLQDLFHLRRSVRHLLRAARMQRESVQRLAAGNVRSLKKETCYQFRDVHDHLLLIHDTLDDHRETLSGLRDTYIGVISNRMNQIMKTLTVFSAILLPLTFLTGLWGMNFPGLPLSKEPGGFWVVVGVCLAVTSLLLWVMFRRGWLRRMG